MKKLFLIFALFALINSGFAQQPTTPVPVNYGGSSTYTFAPAFVSASAKTAWVVGPLFGKYLFSIQYLSTQTATDSIYYKPRVSNDGVIFQDYPIATKVKKATADTVFMDEVVGCTWKYLELQRSTRTSSESTTSTVIINIVK